MKITKSSISDLEAIKSITAKTINCVYPRYYPRDAVDFFLNHHSEKSIITDIESGSVYLCFDLKNNAVGTVTIKANEICRLFVLPEHQGKGYGRALLEFAEKRIAESYDSILIDASLPAKAIYLKRGYSSTEFHSIKTENCDYLCYDVMIKRCGRKKKLD